jgi:hypothetical protein
MAYFDDTFKECSHEGQRASEKETFYFPGAKTLTFYVEALLCLKPSFMFKAYVVLFTLQKLKGD